MSQTTQDPFDQLVDLVRAALPAGAGPAVIDAGTDLKAAGLDSMGTIDLLMRVEDHFGVSLPDDLLNGGTFATPGSLWRVVQEQSAVDAR